MQDAWRAYLELALGLTEASRKRAQDVARKLVGQGGATAAQLQGLAEELRSTGLANRAALTKIVRFEVERTLGAVGLATADEVASLTTRVRELEQELREARRATTAGPGPSAAGAAGPATPGKAVAKLAPEKKAVAKRPAGPAEPAAKKTTPAKKAAKAAPEKAAKAAPAKKVAAKKLPPAAKKTAAKKLPPAAGTGTA